MAMAIGGQADALHVTRDEWRDTAEALGLDATALIEHGIELADRILEELPGVVRDMRDAGWWAALTRRVEHVRGGHGVVRARPMTVGRAGSPRDS